MSRLPSVTPRQLIAALKQDGFEVRRQRGGHVFLWHPERNVVTTVSMHTKDVPRGTLKAILIQAGISEDKFLKLI